MEPIKCQWEDCNILISEREYCSFHEEKALDDEVERDPDEPEIEEDICNQCGKVGCEECKEIDDGCETIYCEPTCSKCNKDEDDCSCDDKEPEDIDVDKEIPDKEDCEI